MAGKNYSEYQTTVKINKVNKTGNKKEQAVKTTGKKTRKSKKKSKEIQFGHTECVEKREAVPSNMGWLWSTKDSLNIFKPGWRPGAVNRKAASNLKSAMISAKKNKRVHDKSVKAKENKTANKEDSILNVKHHEDNVDIILKPPEKNVLTKSKHAYDEAMKINIHHKYCENYSKNSNNNSNDKSQRITHFVKTNSKSSKKKTNRQIACREEYWDIEYVPSASWINNLKQKKTMSKSTQYVLRECDQKRKNQSALKL